MVYPTRISHNAIDSVLEDTLVAMYCSKVDEIVNGIGIVRF